MYSHALSERKCLPHAVDLMNGAGQNVREEKGKDGGGYPGLENWKEQNVPSEDQDIPMAVSLVGL